MNHSNNGRIEGSSDEIHSRTHDIMPQNQSGEPPLFASKSEEQHLRTLVGHNYDYFQRKWQQAARHQLTSSWNWMAFLLGIAWMGYRKMYRYCWLYLAVVSFDAIAERTFDVPSTMSRGFFIGMAFVLGQMANGWYQKQTTQQLREIMASTPVDQISTVLAQRGGTSYWVAAGFIVALMAISILAGL